jgi:hypothetical protein
MPRWYHHMAAFLLALDDFTPAHAEHIYAQCATSLFASLIMAVLMIYHNDLTRKQNSLYL